LYLGAVIRDGLGRHREYVLRDQGSAADQDRNLGGLGQGGREVIKGDPRCEAPTRATWLEKHWALINGPGGLLWFIGRGRPFLLPLTSDPGLRQPDARGLHRRFLARRPVTSTRRQSGAPRSEPVRALAAKWLTGRDRSVDRSPHSRLWAGLAGMSAARSGRRCSAQPPDELVRARVPTGTQWGLLPGTGAYAGSQQRASPGCHLTGRT